MTILVIDGQGGKLGKTLVENIKKSFPHLEIMAVGTNSAASDAMRRAGADRVATGENPVIVACRSAQIIAGPIGIAIADALMGEISPAMANAVAEGMREAGAECAVWTPADVGADAVKELDAAALGCPAMGAEELEETEFAPMFDAVKSALAGKSVGLFGSYGWGDGEWMRTWEEDCGSAGLNRVSDSVICCEAPDDEALAACRALGRKLAE